MAEKVVGILGGMGPEATVELFRRVVKLTPARKEQEHLRIIIDNNPKIPDRTRAILESGESPLPLAAETARNLELAGASFIVIPCNTIHHYIDGIRKSVRIPVLSMIELTVERLASTPDVKRVGIVATTGTMKSALYKKALVKKELEPVELEDKTQGKVMEAVYRVKESGVDEEVRARVSEAIEKLREMGADTILLACTELSLLYEELRRLGFRVYDALQILAEETVKYAGLSVNRSAIYFLA